MLTSGMVPALFPDDEKEAIIGQVQSAILNIRSCNAQSSDYKFDSVACEKSFSRRFSNSSGFACKSGFRNDRAVQHK